MKNNTQDHSEKSAKYISRYKSMIKKQARYYFDVAEFEGIIDYFLENGKVSEAKSAISYAEKLHPDSVILQLKKVHILIDNEEKQEALKLLTKLQTITPDDSEIYFLFGFIEVSNGNLTNAEEYFNKYFYTESNVTDEILSSVAFVYEQFGYYEKALEFLQKAFDKNPKNKYVLYDTAYCSEQVGDLEKSVKFYEKYLEEEPLSANAWYNYGVISNELKNYDKALAAYDFAIAIKPGFSSAYFNKAAVLTNQNKFEEAIEIHKEFLKIEHDNVEAHTRIAECYRKIEDYKNSMIYYKNALSFSKNYLDALYGVASVYYLQEDYFEGLNYIIRAAKISKNNFEYHFLKARFFAKLNYVEKAEESYVDALELNKDSEKIWVSFIELFEKTDLGKAMEILEKALWICPESELIAYKAAGIFYVLEDYSKVQEFLSKINSSDMLTLFFDENPQASENEIFQAYFAAQ